MKKVHKQIFLLILFLGILTVGVLDAEYGLVRIFVRFVCASCSGLG